MNKNPGTVRTKLTLLVVACVLPIALVAALSVYVPYKRERTQIKDVSISRTRAMVFALDREFSRTESALFALGTSPYLTSNNLRNFHTQARQALKHINADSIVLVDTTGRFLLNTRIEFGEPLPRLSSAPLLKRIVDTGRPGMSNLFTSPLTGKPVVAIGIPVRSNDTVVYTLNAILEPHRLSSILVEQNFPDSWRAAVADSTGTIVARTHEPAKYIGKKVSSALLQRSRDVQEDAFESKTLEEIPVLTAFSTSQDHHWMVALGTPLAELTANIHRTAAWLIAATLAALMIGLLFAKMISNKIARSIHDLVEPAMALGHGRPVVIPKLHFEEAESVGAALVTAAGLLLRRTVERDQAEKSEQELRVIKQRLEDSEAFQRNIFEAAPDAILLVAQGGKIVHANQQAEKVFGYAYGDLVTLIVEDLIPQKFRHHHGAHRDQYFSAPEQRPMGNGMNLLGRRANGEEFPVDVTLSPLQSAQGPLVIATVRDVTQRRHQEAALRESEVRFHNAFNLGLIGKAFVGLDNRFIQVNDTLCSLLGHTNAELLGVSQLDLSCNDGLANEKACCDKLLMKQYTSRQFEKHYRTKDGHTLQVLISASLLWKNDDPYCYLYQIQNVTERKMLRDLSAHQESIREEERKRIARDIHDDLGSVLTGIKAYLSVAIDTAETNGAKPDRDLVEASGLTDTAIETVRRVITDLRPSVLDQLGLWAALEWYAEQIQKQSGLQCACTVDEAAMETEIDAERSIALFRIVQETFTNVVRHAHASHVTIHATCENKMIMLEIEDNGAGIKLDRLFSKGSWGIAGMHERVRYFNGKLNISGIAGKGTVVQVQIPLHAEALN